MVSRPLSMKSLKAKPRRNLALKMKRSSVTVAIARLEMQCPTDDFSQQLAEAYSMVQMAADQSLGVVTAVVSFHCIIHWNGSQPCTNHVAQGLHWIDMMVNSSAGSRFSFGLASGMAHSGNVPAVRRRYVTIAGGCVELAMALAEAALLRQRVLLAGVVGRFAASRGEAYRLELWREATRRGQQESPPIIVWGFSTAPKSLDTKWAVATSIPPTYDGSKVDEAFIRAADSGSLAELQELSAGGCQDLDQTLYTIAQSGGESITLRKIPALYEFHET